MPCLHDCSDSLPDLVSISFIVLFSFPMSWTQLSFFPVCTLMLGVFFALLQAYMSWLPRNTSLVLRPSSALSNANSSFKKSDKHSTTCQNWAVLWGLWMGMEHIGAGHSCALPGAIPPPPRLWCKSTFCNQAPVRA